MSISFKKVKHAGCHQDYRVICDDTHIGNIRAGFKKKGGRTISWSARTDVNGVKIVLSGRDGQSRMALALSLLRVMKTMGAFGTTRVPYMQLTEDVGAYDRQDEQDEQA